MNTLLILLINFIIGVIVAILHEVPKNIAAYFLTHPVYRKQVKMNNPLKYIDVLGAIIFAFSSFAVGWQKPYKYECTKFKMKESGFIVLAIVGEISSLFFAICLVPILRYLELGMPVDLTARYYLWYAVMIAIRYNLILFLINLLPVIPFDMSYIVRGISNERYLLLKKNDVYLKFFFLFFISSGLIWNIVNYLMKKII